jgi:phage-related protein
LAALRELLARFKIDVDSKPLQQGDAAVEGFAGKLRKLGGIIAGAAVVVGIKNFVSGIAATGDELDKTSQRLGVTTDDLQALRHAAGLSGASAGELDGALVKLNANLADAAVGAGTASKALKAAGIGVKDLDGNVRSASESLPEIADAFKKLQSPADRTRFAMDLFGRSGHKLIPLLEKGSAGIAEMRTELDKLGGGMSKDAIKASADLTDAMARMDLSFLSIKSRLAVALLPAIEAMTKAFTRAMAWITKLTDNTNILQSVLILIGGSGTVAVLKLVGGFRGLFAILGKVLLRLALPVLLLDELITTFQGGDTLITRAIDSMFGEGATAKAVKWIKDTWNGFKQFFSDIKNKPGEFAETFARTLKSIGDDVEKVFGAAGRFIYEAFISAIGLVTGGWSGFVKQMGEFWDGLRAITGAVVDAIAQLFSQAVAGIQNTFTGLWNSIVSGAQMAVGAVQKLLSSIPGAGALLSKVTGALEGIKGKAVEVDVKSFDQLVRNNMPTATQQASRPGATNNQQNVSQQSNTEIKIFVPPGTPAQVAQSAGQAAGKAVTQSNRAAFNAVAFRPG